MRLRLTIEAEVPDERVSELQEALGDDRHAHLHITGTSWGLSATAPLAGTFVGATQAETAVHA